MSRPHPNASAAGLLLAAASLAGCSSIRATAANLDALHGEGGRHRYSAELTSPWRMALASFSRDFTRSEEAWVAGSVRKRVKNPAGRVLRDLLDLASHERETPAVQATQVRAYAWLAMVDPSALVRERALLELGPHAERLGLEPPLALPDPTAVVDPEELLVLVRGLYEVVPPVLEGGARASETQRADMAAAVELLRERSYDVEGGRRLLKAVAVLVEGERASRPALAPLIALSEQVQRSLCAQALARGLLDGVPRVRAAAFEAAHRAFGEPFLAEAILCLDAVDAGPPGAGLDRFRLVTPSPADEELYVAVYRMVREHGLPGGDPWDEGLDEGSRGLRVLAMKLALLRVALNYTRYGDRSRTAAVMALAAVAPEGPDTLRSEEWQDWWSGWAEDEGRRLRELAGRASGGAAQEP